MKAVKSTMLAMTSVGALLTVLTSGPALATPIYFTWAPSLTANSATPTVPGSEPLSSGAAFESSDLTISDYSVINATNLNAVTETTILPVVSANAYVPGPGSPPAVEYPFGNAPGLNGASGGTPYQMYFVVTSTSSISGSGSTYSGAFTTLSYTLYGVNDASSGDCTFSITATGPQATGCGTLLTLAQGGLPAGPNNIPGVNNIVSVTAGLPSAHVDATIGAGANAGGFFVSPTNLALINFESAFTNTPADIYYCSVETANPQSAPGCSNLQTDEASNAVPNLAADPFIEIENPGGGSVDVITGVPEPYTLALFGGGLIGLGFFGRRRRKTA